MVRAKSLLTAIIGVLPPSRLKNALLRGMGHRVPEGCRVGACLIIGSRLLLDERCTIGNFNVIGVRRLVMRRQARMGTMNYLRGVFSVRLGAESSLGNRNKVAGLRLAGTTRQANLWLGIRGSVTASHLLDVGETIWIGDDTTIAGNGTQIWTHGFIHVPGETTRSEVRGRVRIGSLCYIGSRCCITGGVRIADRITVAAQTSVGTNLTEPGMYVSQPLRYINKSAHERLATLRPIGRGASPQYWKELS